MGQNASVGRADRLNHLKVVALAMIAALAITFVGMTARATDDLNGYGVATIAPLSTPSSGDAIPAR